MMSCPLGGSENKKELTAQEKVTLEWDAMAGEWDDLAAGYAAGFYRFLLQPPQPSDSSNHDKDDKDHDDHRRVRITTDTLRESVVVDFGCGTGLLTERLQQVSKQVIAIDVSPNMMDLLQDKIQSREWSNVTGLCVALADVRKESSNDDEVQQEQQQKTTAIRRKLGDLAGTVDLIVASSVLTFIPEEDMKATMREIGMLLKPGTGLFCHSDWPKSEAKHPDAMTTEKATTMYDMAGMDAESMRIVTMSMDHPDEGVQDRTDGSSASSLANSVDVFFGVARKRETTNGTT